MIAPSAAPSILVSSRIGREADRRFIGGLAVHDYIAAGQAVGHALQVDGREDHLGAGRADVDSDRGQRHVVALPDRVVLQRAGVDVVMIVIGVAVVIMRVEVAEHVIVDACGGRVLAGSSGI